MGGIFPFPAEVGDGRGKHLFQGSEGLVPGKTDAELADGFARDAVHGGGVRPHDRRGRVHAGEGGQEGVTEFLGQEVQPLVVAVFQGDVHEAGVGRVAPARGSG